MVPSFRPNTSTCWACRSCADACSTIKTSRRRPRLRSSIRPRLAPTGRTRTRWANVSACTGCPRTVESAKPAWTTIVGVIADARTESLADAVAPQIYRTVYQHPAPRPGHLSSRTTRSPRHPRASARAGPGRRSGTSRSSMPRPWMTCSPPRSPSGDSQWKWSRFLRPLPCCSPDLESTEPSPMW